MERLGPTSAIVVPGLLQALGEMANAREPSSWQALTATLGVLLRVAGPERVLSALPLNLQVNVP